MELDQYLQQAKDNPTFRQELLNSINLEGTYIKSLNYISNDSPHYKLRWRLDPRIAHTLVRPFKQFSRNKKSRIDVFPSAFSGFDHLKIDDLISTLIDHEGFHAKQVAEKSFVFYLAKFYFVFSDSLTIERFINKREYPAFLNQVKNFNKRDVSLHYRSFIEKSLLSIEERLGIEKV